MHRLRVWMSPTVTFLAVAIGLRAQEPNRLSLRPPALQFAEEFTAITSVREIAGGRVLVIDERDNRIVVADFVKNTATRIGRVGSGPNEDRRVGRLWPLDGDSTVMVDP
jgi:hypothetical protein